MLALLTAGLAALYGVGVWRGDVEEGARPTLFGIEASRSTGVESAEDEDGDKDENDDDEDKQTTTTTKPKAREFTLVAGGDVLLHEALWRQARDDAEVAGAEGFDFAPLLSSIEPMVAKADLAICHMETVLAPPGGPYSGYPSFSVPPEIAPALAATGFDACSTASNHTYDEGADGIENTLNMLDASGIAHAGSARSEEEAASTTLLNANGASVALLSYTYGFNGIPAPNDEEWHSNEIDQDRILADAATARSRGADVVVVAMQWGDEYDHEPNDQQREMAPLLIGSPDIDLLLGHHSHVVQPIEKVNGEWVVYGMGNMVAHQSDSLGSVTEEGLLTQFTFTETEQGWQVTDAAFEPILTERDASPIRVTPVGPALANPAIEPDDAERFQEARDRTTDIVSWNGALAAGLHPVTP